MKNLAFILTLVFFISSCEKDEGESQAEKDDKIISEFLTSNNINATKHSSGLYYLITKEGSGSHPNYTSEVTVRYKGYFLDGSVFDETAGTSTIDFPLTNVIIGWQYGIPLLKMGGKGTFYIPSTLAYGANARNGIPANSILVFDVELVDIN